MNNIILMDHNVPSFNKIVELFAKGSTQIIYTSGTGTGKAYIAMALIERYFKNTNVLFVIPKNAIASNIKAYPEFQNIKDYVTFINIQQFNSIRKAKNLLKGVSLVIVDESHHVGSSIYGNYLLQALSACNTLTLALTATPLRSDKKDVRNEFENVVNGLSTFDCIRLGLSPMINYRLMGSDEDLVEYRRQIHEREEYLEQNGIRGRGVVRRNFMDGYHILKKTIEKYPQDKWICYSPDIESLLADEELIQKLFPDRPIFKIFSGYEKADEDVINAFEQEPKAVLMSVDKATEGFHLKAYGIIILRNIQSLLLFEQIIGRVISMGNTTTPTILDLTDCGPQLLEQLQKENDRKWKDPTASEIEVFDAVCIAKYQMPYKEYKERLEAEQEKKEKEKVPEKKKQENNRDVVHIGLGADREWTSLYEFSKAWAEADPVKHKDLRNQKAQAALELYKNTMRVVETQKVSEKTRENIIKSIVQTTKITVDEFKRMLAEDEYDEKRNIK